MDRYYLASGPLHGQFIDLLMVRNMVWYTVGFRSRRDPEWVFVAPVEIEKAGEMLKCHAVYWSKVKFIPANLVDHIKRDGSDIVGFFDEGID